MSHSITDIAEWEKRYPFLEKFWGTYNEFDKTLDGDRYKHLYEAFCTPLMEQLDDNKLEHKNLCLKLVRNLGCYPLEYHRYFHPNKDRCNILHYWIYNSVKNLQISNNLITHCFSDYKDHMRKIYITPKCHYNPYEDNYKEPMNMIILEIFQSTMKTVTDMLDKKNDKINYDLQKYICECVKIYKEMYKTYCRNKDEDNKSELTCSTLNTVKQTYNWFLSGKSYKNYYIPSLDKDDVEYLAMCPQDNPGSELTPKADATVSLSSSLSGVRDGYTVGIPSPGGDNNDEADSFSSSTAVNVENQASSMSRSVSTAVGTVAGASSILALLYKFTPGRN
ncbi:Plasmodium vivax Vir protein, putative [Plasmodium vivax]|nr:Plasmodium vivax Vir protein, putative [Plasmodium vivax]